MKNNREENNITTWKEKSKHLISQNAIIEIATILLSTCIEIFRQLALYIKNHKEDDINIKHLFINVAQDLNTLNAVINIILVTVIIWCVTGVATIIKNRAQGKTSLVFTLTIFSFLIASLLWYVISIFFKVDVLSIIISVFLAGGMFILLLLYFAENPKTSTINDNDNVIAPTPLKKI